MLIKIVGGVLAVILIFLGYVSTREGKFHYERSGVIQAPAEKIFPYISQFRLGSQWSPYEKLDPNMKKTYTEVDGQVGSGMKFDGNSQSGSGQLEILNMVPNESVEIKLTMLKPFHAENIVTYKLTSEAEGTRFTWSMHGDGGFMNKLMTVFIDCEKMVGDQFLEGIQSLKTLMERQEVQ